MAEFKINEALWNTLSEEQQVHVDNILREVQILRRDDIIVADPNTPRAEYDRDDFPPYWGAPDDCVAACEATIDIMMINCVAMGGTEVMCGLAAQAVFQKCCEACEEGFG